uniref:Uncharacterized protein LOC104238200 n=1 Tax=Nicotiana sylvestris TaxID=4096 RepID=A0A1U7XV44_NICSY|nr:PREDICTED: uncharacterized protein LOC104238200 [Nicotiana sylvestris]
MASKCWCCVKSQEETVAHVFFTSYAAKKVWTYFFSYAGLSLEGLSLHQAIVRCWVVQQICTTIQSMVKVRKPGIIFVPHRWPDVLNKMENYRPILKFNKVTWEFPLAGWIKINIDGASRQNPGRSSIGYCIRNDKGDLVYAVGKEIKETTNTQAEARAILEALRYCTIHHTQQIWLETDSMLLKNTIEGNWKPP